jgi:hypothetical protein
MENKKRSQKRPSSSFPQITPPHTSKGNENCIIIRFRKNPDGTEELLGLFYNGKTIPTPCLVEYGKDGKILDIRFTEWQEHFKQDRDLPAWMEYFKNCWPRTFEAIQSKASEKDKLMAYTLDAVSLTKSREAGLKRIDTKDTYRIENALKEKSSLLKLDSLDRLLIENWHRKHWMNITLERLGEVCGKALKRKPFPKTTMQKRLDALLLQTQVKPGARPKPASLKAVSRYTKQRNGLQSIKNRIGKRVL